jgi:hypothetical protein
VNLSSLPHYKGGSEPHAYPKELGHDRHSLDYALNVVLALAIGITITVIFIIMPWIIRAAAVGAAGLACD